MDNAPDNQTQKTDRSISLFAANGIAIFLAVPIFGVFLPLYIWLWGPESVEIEVSFNLWDIILLLFVFFGGITVHEILHGVSWQIFGGKPRRAVEYGMKWQILTPYAHMKEPIEVRAYMIGGLMPGLVLGLLPTLAGLTLGSGWLFAFGLVFTWAASGDFIVLWLLRDVKPGTLVEDHPDRAGCLLLEAEA